MILPPLLVLAGGFGTRLQLTVADVPKPLAPVASRPFLSYLLDSWIDQGVREFFFLLHHQAYQIEAFLKSETTARRLKGLHVQTLTEAQPMGTGGSVALAVKRLQLRRSFLVANADTWLGSGIAALAFAPTPSIAVLKIEKTERYGSVELAENRIVSFSEKQNSSGPGWISAGIYHLNPELFANWNGDPFSLEQTLFPALAKSGCLQALPLQTEFIDIGIPADYFRFCQWIDSKKKDVL